MNKLADSDGLFKTRAERYPPPSPSWMLWGCPLPYPKLAPGRNLPQIPQPFFRGIRSPAHMIQVGLPRIHGQEEEGERGDTSSFPHLLRPHQAFVVSPGLGERRS